MTLRLENRSGYDTGDLRRFVRKGMRACRLRTLDVVFVSSPIRSRGCADVGGRRMVIAIAPPSRYDLRRLARLFEHEAAHLRGMEHEGMPRDLLYSLGDVPRWARGAKLRYLGHAPNQLQGSRVSTAEAARDPNESTRFHVYAVLLVPGRTGRSSVYVGHSALPPEQRLRRHRSRGPSSSGVVRRRAVRLMPEATRGIGPFSRREDARRAERELARRLARRGYHVVGACSPRRTPCALG